MRYAPGSRLTALLFLVGLLTVPTPGGARADDPPPGQARRVELAARRGRELFARQWLPDDARSRGGDGLGPVYNERSCLNCHDQGGPGGAGPADKNIELITPAAQALDGAGNPGFFYYAFSYSFGPNGFEYHFGDPKLDRDQGGKPAAKAPIAAELAQIHPGFRNAPSVVLHRYGGDNDYRTWREWVLGKHGSIAFRTSQRNPPPLFGTGLIDAIPDQVIEAAARHHQPGVRGRASKLPDGRIGRFGWKAQTATLSEFILNAAAVELGLESPGHAQAADPRIPPLAAPGLDLNKDDGDALIAYVRTLPAPVVEPPIDARTARAVRSGKAVFRSLGCASCHVQKLGSVNGIHSDLLLHEMSPELSDTGLYGAFLADPNPPAALAPPGRAGQAAGKGDFAPAKLEEWRTPPLWGLRDSFPYMHDGRAATIDQAIRMHGGEAAAAAQRYRQLPARDRGLLESFLLSLAAPPQGDNLARKEP